MLIVVLMAVQELCWDPHGVLAFTRESSGCVWQALHPTHPAPRRRLRRHAGSANWVNVRCDCEGLRRDLKIRSTTVDAESLCAAGGNDSNGRCGISY